MSLEDHGNGPRPEGLKNVEELESLGDVVEHSTPASGLDWATRTKIVALSPFIYVGLGMLFGWWAWAWLIIPVSAIILCSGLSRGLMFIALSPFIYVLFGFIFGWWAWGWALIPISGILLYDK